MAYTVGVNTTNETDFPSGSRIDYIISCKLPFQRYSFVEGHISASRPVLSIRPSHENATQHLEESCPSFEKVMFLVSRKVSPCWDKHDPQTNESFPSQNNASLDNSPCAGRDTKLSSSKARLLAMYDSRLCGVIPPSRFLLQLRVRSLRRRKGRSR